MKNLVQFLVMVWIFPQVCLGRESAFILPALVNNAIDKCEYEKR